MTSFRRAKSGMRSEKGMTLMEVLVGLAILAIAGSGIFAALQLSSRMLVMTDVRDTAKDLAELQLEYVKSLPYATSYEAAPIPPESASYSVVISSSPLRDGNLQKITVSIDHNGAHVITIDDYKVNW